jgi:hypothetical protein
MVVTYRGAKVRGCCTLMPLLEWRIIRCAFIVRGVQHMMHMIVVN